MTKNKLCAKFVNDRTFVASLARSVDARPTWVFFRRFFRTSLCIIGTLFAAVPAFGIQEGSLGECLAREGTKSIIDKYVRKLFVTPDEVARYVFLTNRHDDGDRSAAVYRVRHKEGSLPGAYWVTVTEAPDRLTAATRNIRVERYDAPLPASAAHAVHALWEGVLKRSPLDEHAIPCAPTAVFSVKATNRARLSAVTVYLDYNSLCHPLLTLGACLVDYGKLPASQRVEAARKIEEESRRLLARVSQKR